MARSSWRGKRFQERSDRKFPFRASGGFIYIALPSIAAAKPLTCFASPETYGGDFCAMRYLLVVSNLNILSSRLPSGPHKISGMHLTPCGMYYALFVNLDWCPYYN
jgi:hypothetical protein